jgi:hypothetical protein
MTPLQALREGARRVVRAPAVLGGTFALTLLVAMPLAIALRGMLEAHLGASLAADAAARGANYEWWQEFSAQAVGLGTTFVPSIIGFGAVLLNLSNLLDNLPMAATIAGVTGAWLVLWAFLSGGLIDRFARDRATRARGFFGACGAHAGPILRLGVCALIVYWLLFRWLHPFIFTRLYAGVTHETAIERTAFLIRLIAYGAFGMTLAIVNVVFDYARIRIVVEDRRSALGGLLAGGRFARRQAGGVAALYSLNAAAFLALIAIYGAVAPGVVPAGVATWMMLILGEAYILARHFLKLTFYASETAFFQSRLAHAAYTAGPPVVWPESPAAESIANAAPSGLR